MTYHPKPLIDPRFLRSSEGTVSQNERMLLRLIWRNQGILRREIPALTNLTQPSVHRILDQLVDRGVLRAGSPTPGQGRGQPSPALYLDGSYAYSCGISLNTDVIGICLVDLSGQIIGNATVDLREKRMEDALSAVRGEIRTMQTKHGLDEAAMFGIGFAIAGYHVGGTRYNAPLPLHEWSLIELGPLLSEFFSKPVWVHNGANTAAMAEAMFGIGRHIKHFGYLSFNYGFGGGLISDGELLLGGNGNAGSFSGMYEGAEREKRPALQFLIERLNKNAIKVPSVDYLRRHFDRQWPGAKEWVEETTPAYNRLINAIMAIFDPQAIVFGGEIPSALAQMFIDRTTVFTTARYGISRPMPKLIISEIENDASALGAAIVPFREEFY